MPFYIREMDEMTMGPYSCIEDAIETIEGFEEHDRSIGAFVKDSYRIIRDDLIIYSAGKDEEEYGTYATVEDVKIAYRYARVNGHNPVIRTNEVYDSKGNILGWDDVEVE